MNDEDNVGERGKIFALFVHIIKDFREIIVGKFYLPEPEHKKVWAITTIKEKFRKGFVQAQLIINLSHMKTRIRKKADLTKTGNKLKIVWILTESICFTSIE